MVNISQENFSRLEELANEICLRENCRLYDIELAGDTRGRVLRVWIDKAPVAAESESAASESEESGETGDSIPGAVSISDCANVSNGLSLRLDVEDIIPGGAYHLEVSSPGMDRRLKKPWHYQTAVGKIIRCRLHGSLASLAGAMTEEVPAHWLKKKQVEERLQAADEDGALFTIDDRSVKIAYQDIEKANVVVEFGEPRGNERGKHAPGKKPGKGKAKNKAKKKR